VRRYARELGVNIADVSGSGPGGRIGQQDVKQRVQTLLAGGATGRPAAPPLPDFSRWGEVDVTPMSNIRRKTAEQLSASWIAPHVTQHEKADVTALEAFRKDYGRRVEAAGGKLTITAILVKICALAIQRFPEFASSVDMVNQTVIVKKYCHIGLAVDTPNGLLVPVIRDADRKTLTEVAVEMGALSKKARDKKLGGGYTPHPPRQEARPRRDGRRRLYDYQPRRTRRHGVHAHRQPAGGGDSWRLAWGDGAGLA
jgi:pyruvate dehydrogenase E2 component (dihydrolipoamide acetyltransferase)